MSIRNTNLIYFILFIFILIGKIKNNPGHPFDDNHQNDNHPNDDDKPKDNHPNDDDKPKDNHPPEDDIGKNTKTNNESKFNNNDDSKRKNLDELREKTQNMIKQNIEVKKKLQKYHLYYYIFVILNIIFAFIILSFIFYKVYSYYHKKILNSNISMVSIVNNDSEIAQNNNNNNKKDFERIITNYNFVIQGSNNFSQSGLESFNRDESVAPAVNGYVGNDKH